MRSPSARRIRECPAVGGGTGRGLLGGGRDAGDVPARPPATGRPRLARRPSLAPAAALPRRARLACAQPRWLPLPGRRPRPAGVPGGTGRLGLRLPGRGGPGGRAAPVAGARAGALPTPLLAPAAAG